MDVYQIVKRPLHNEKSVKDSEDSNAYHFEVAVDATKDQVKKAVEKIFEVKVIDVRTMMKRGKKRRYRYKMGTTRSWKKAIVKLVEGDTIDLGY